MHFDLNVLAIVVGILALLISAMSWRTAIHSNRAAIFSRRFEVYEDVVEFLRPWFRDGRPDLDQLRMLIEAWDRSHFLFDASVTAYIRQLWLDAISVEHDRRVIAGELHGDRQAAIERAHRLTIRYLDDGAVRQAFLPHMRIETSDTLSTSAVRIRHIIWSQISSGWTWLRALVLRIWNGLARRIGLGRD